jgi:fructuronate reductase
LGAFFKAHGAIYVAEAMRASGGDWASSASASSAPTNETLSPPQASPTPRSSSVRTAKLRRHRRRSNVLVAREDPQAVLAAMANPAVRIVSLTVTEKGYCHEPASGRLNSDHPDIRLIWRIRRATLRARISRARPATPPGRGTCSLHRALLR